MVYMCVNVCASVVAFCGVRFVCVWRFVFVSFPIDIIDEWRSRGDNRLDRGVLAGRGGGGGHVVDY